MNTDSIPNKIGMKKRVKILLDLSTNDDTIKKCDVIPWGFDSDCNNNLYLATKERILVLSIKKLTENKNWFRASLNLVDL